MIIFFQPQRLTWITQTRQTITQTTFLALSVTFMKAFDLKNLSKLSRIVEHVKNKTGQGSSFGYRKRCWKYLLKMLIEESRAAIFCLTIRAIKKICLSSSFETETIEIVNPVTVHLSIFDS
jgi:hypothetical protein